MKWYYADDGQQAGPFDETEIQELGHRGKITPDTLVWHSGMSEWQPYRKVRNRDFEIKPKTGGTTAAPDHPEDSFSEGSIIEISPEAAMACSECGRPFSEEEMIRYGNIFICETCNPEFVRKIKEEDDTGLRYAGFWIRFCAKIIDNFILMTTVMFIGYFIEKPGDSFSELHNFLTLLLYLITAGYEVWFLEKFGATPGKMVFGLKVVTPDGGGIGYLRALGRAFARELSSMAFSLGYIMAAFDSQKRALHDRICATRVIYFGSLLEK